MPRSGKEQTSRWRVEAPNADEGSFRELRGIGMRGTRRTAFGIFAITFIVYVFPLVYDLVHKPFFTWAPGQDIASTSLLPIVILERGDFTLNEYQDFFKSNYHEPYFVANVNGRLVSRYPTTAAVLAIPFYGVPLGTGWIARPPYSWLSFPWSGFFPAKFAATFITALAVVMFFFCARELADLKTSTALTIIFAFATSVWSTASQGLWQQTPSVLFQVIAIWFVLRGGRRGANAIAPGAFFFSAATISRLSDGLPALLFTAYVLLIYRSAFTRWALWAIPPAVFAFVYNTIYNGSPFVFGYQEGLLNYISVSNLDGLLGLFISPSRGLFVYSPFFLFALAGVWHSQSDQNYRFYSFATLTCALGILVLGAQSGWSGGWGYGTRLLTDFLPYATLLLIPVLRRLRGVPLYAFCAMVAYAMLLQTFGLWDYGVRWHWHWDNYDFNVWDVAENEPLFYLKEYVTMIQQYWSIYGFH